MKNQVTVTLFLPWLAALPKAEYHRLYRKLSMADRDTSGHTYPETCRLMSALAAKRETYSFETAASDVSFPRYAALSLYVPGQELVIRVTKAGPHIQSGTRADVTYYNAVQAEYAKGVMVSQMIGHVDSTGDVAMTDTVTLSGTSMYPTLAALKGTAMMEAAKHERSKTVASVLAAKQAETGMSL